MLRRICGIIRLFGAANAARGLTFTRYCYCQYCMVYSIHTGGRKGSLILFNHRAIVLHQGGQCRWVGGMKGWLIRAQSPLSKRISCEGQLAVHHGDALGVRVRG